MSHEHHGLLNDWQPNCLFSSWFRLTTEKNIKSSTFLALWEENPPVTGGFPSWMVSDAESVSMPRCHHTSVQSVRYIVQVLVKGIPCPGARLTNDFSIEFEIRPNFVVLWFKMRSTDHNKILHISRQCNCCEVCKISLWSVKHILN